MRRWGVIGSGNMASLFVKDSQKQSQGEFIAVYSSSQQRAEQFASEHQLAKAYSSLADLLADPDIDAVYIASRHPQHVPQAIQALNAGKHVLVEKPIALNSVDAERVFEAAKQNQRFCCEALWSKFSASYQALIAQLAAGRIGEVRHVHAHFGFAIDMTQPEQRLLNPLHAGGALLDIGLYPIFLPLSVFGGPPSQTQAQVTIGQTGVDIAADLLMSFTGGRSASVAYRFDAMMPNKAVISGSNGWVELETPFFANNALHWTVANGPTVTEYHPMDNRGWGEEFGRVNEAIDHHQLEADEHSWDDSRMLARYLETVRKTWGPTYPFE